MGINFNQINQTIGQQTKAAEGDLKSWQGKMDPNSSADMLQMQQKMQKWSLTTNLQSTVIKELSDALKGVIQKF